MVKKEEILKKANQAADLLYRSIGEKGIYAGAGQRYRHQYWTRDLVYAFIPAIIAMTKIKGLSPLFNIGIFESASKGQLFGLAGAQSVNGAVPILFSDFSKFLINKLRECVWDGTFMKADDSFMMRRALDGLLGDSTQFPEFSDFPRSDERGLYRLTPGTTDSEILFALGAATIPALRSNALRAIEYAEQNYVWDGLHHGADWRDTMDKVLCKTPLLSNNSLLYAAYKALGLYEKAESLKTAINKAFWNGTSYIDHPGSNRFDPLGASFAIMFDLIGPHNFGSVTDGFRSVDSPCGVTIQCRHNPYQKGEAETIEQTNGVVVWPFVVGYTVLALLKFNPVFAFEQFEKLHALSGFAEYYSPADGSLWGEYEQGWSAALYLCAASEILKLL